MITGAAPRQVLGFSPRCGGRGAAAGQRHQEAARSPPSQPDRRPLNPVARAAGPVRLYGSAVSAADVPAPTLEAAEAGPRPPGRPQTGSFGYWRLARWAWPRWPAPCAWTGISSTFSLYVLLIRGSMTTPPTWPECVSSGSTSTACATRRCCFGWR